MKKYLILILISLFLSGCSTPVENKDSLVQKEDKQIINSSRKDELQLEGFINDYFYRRKIKDQFLFSDYEAYSSVLAKSIVVYVYPKEKLSQFRINEIKETITKDLHDQILVFPGFEWTNEYKFDVVFR